MQPVDWPEGTLAEVIPLRHAVAPPAGADGLPTTWPDGYFEATAGALLGVELNGGPMTEVDNWHKRIHIDKAIHHGDPCIIGTRVPVSVIVGSLAEGDSWEQVLKSYPQLKREDIQAALLYAAEAVNRFELISPGN
jgi:uncharacterized protein (DUF433 family)